jgi:6-phosphogluconolactonase
MDLQVFQNAESLAAAAADRFVGAASAAIRERGQFHVALAGGQTPRKLYERLAAMAATSLEWSAVHTFFGDERPVPPDHAESNFRMATESLLSRVPLPAANVHRLRGELPPEQAANEYEQELRRVFCTAVGEWPRFDLILLGMGADGHTASLFPGTAALRETQRLVRANWVPKFAHHRLTLTLPVLTAARRVWFLVAGADKAQAVKEVFARPIIEPPPPAALVQPTNGELAWLLDAAAAGLIGGGVAAKTRHPD